MTTLEEQKAAWKAGKCTVPMFSSFGIPDGFCGRPAHGPQLPAAVLLHQRGMRRLPYCAGHCCPAHGGPEEGEPIIFQDGLTEQGRPMWCAVMPDFESLQEGPAGFSGDPLEALRLLANARRTVADAINDIRADLAEIASRWDSIPPSAGDEIQTDSEQE